MKRYAFNRKCIKLRHLSIITTNNFEIVKRNTHILFHWQRLLMLNPVVLTMCLSTNILRSCRPYSSLVQVGQLDRVPYQMFWISKLNWNGVIFFLHSAHYTAYDCFTKLRGDCPGDEYDLDIIFFVPNHCSWKKHTPPCDTHFFRNEVTAK